MIVPPGATSISIDVQFLDDTGAAVTGKVASDFPACKWSSGTNTADTTITLSDLAAITTAHPNDNTAGGIKEREGGWYRLDLPNNVFTSAGRKTITFAETTNKRILAPTLDCQYVQSDERQMLGSATPITNLNQIFNTDYATLYDTTNKAFLSKLGNFAMGGSSLALTTGAIACTTITASGAVAFQSTFAVTGTTTLTGAVTASNASNNIVGVSLAANQHVIVDSGTVTTLSNLPSIPNNWLTAAGIAASALNGKGDWLVSSSYPTNFGSLAIDSSGRTNAFMVGILTSTFTEGATGRIAAGFKQWFNVATPTSTMNEVTLVDTITTYTGDTPQTGDSFARIGATGSGLTSLAPSSTALSTATWTGSLATNLTTLASHDPGTTIGTSTLTQTQVTGGAYSVQSASCVLGDARIAHLDADVSSRMATFTLPTHFSSLSIDANGRVEIQSGVTKNAAIDNFEFPLYNSTDHVSPVTGASVTAQRSIDGAAYGSCTNAVSEVGSGTYKINLSASDLNGNVIKLLFTASGADAQELTILTTP